MTDIACATDAGYAPHCAAMLHSLFTHNPAAAHHVHVLHDARLPAETIEKLRGFVTGAGARFTALPVDPASVADFPDRRFHISCWYRVLLPQMLPRTSRILYLDSDLLVTDSFAPLSSIAIADACFAAACNPLYPFMPDRAASLGLSGPREYLNSGVLLMNLQAMRHENVLDRLRRYAKENPDNPWPEQDALSVVCRGRWQPLPPRFNAQTTVFDLPDSQLPFSPAECAEARQRPVGSSRVDLQACKLEYSIVSPK